MRFVAWLTCGLLFLTGISIAQVQAEAVQTQEPLPIVVRQGHFYRGQERVRLWGANFCTRINPANKDLPLCFDRLTDLGINGVRLNLFDLAFTDNTQKITVKPFVTTKGDDSNLDRLDHCIKLAADHGMIFWMHLSRYTNFSKEDYDLFPDDGTREEWNKYVEIGTDVAYLSERAEKVAHQYAHTILNRLNPWTGLRYADDPTIGLYEVSNENGFVEKMINTGYRGNAAAELLVRQRWNAWLKQRYGTSARLSNAWGGLADEESLEKDSVAYLPTLDGMATMGAGYQASFTVKNVSGATKYSAQRAEDVIRFATDLYIGYNKRFIEYARSLSTGEAGAKSALYTPTGTYNQFLPTWYAANSVGDFASAGNYGFSARTWEESKSSPFYPYQVRVNSHPMMESPVDLLRPANRPYMIYETNDYRPNPYLIEFPMRVGLAAIWNDMDGVFWFNWDDPYFHPKFTSDEVYANSALPMPNTGYPNAGILLANDEVELAVIKSVGVLFRRGGLAPASDPKVYTVGRDILFNPNRTSLSALSPMGDMPMRVQGWSWRTGTRINYSPNTQSSLLNGYPPTTGSQIKMGQNILCDWSKQRGKIEIDSPTSRVFLGFTTPDMKIGDLTLSGVNRPFSYIAFVAEDGRSLAKSKSILVTMVSKSTNTGFKIDFSQSKSQWAQGLAEAVVDGGHAPVIVDRVAAVATAPWLRNMKCEKYDFARRKFAENKLDGVFTVTADEPMFYARLTRP